MAFRVAAVACLAIAMSLQLHDTLASQQEARVHNAPQLRLHHSGGGGGIAATLPHNESTLAADNSSRGLGVEHGTATYDWDAEAAGFYRKYHYCFVAAAVLYYPTIFGLKRYMAGREPIQLKEGKVNYVYWWHASLAVFSMLGTINVLPFVLHTVYGHGSHVLCMNNLHSIRPVGVWSLAFAVSKVAEFGDTLLIVLRKKELRLIQYYHHLMTMLYCWAGLLFQAEHNNVIFVFGSMNYAVHSVMYSWYAYSALGYRSPKWVMMAVTLLQLMQMFVGVGATLRLSRCEGVMQDEVQYNMLSFAAFMYGGYVLLFGRLFHTSYFGRRAQNVKHKRGGSAAKGEGEQATAKQGESSSSSVLSPLTRAQSSVFEALKEE